MSQDVLEKEVVQTFRALPPEKKKEALNFLEFLKSRVSKEPSSSLEGLWKHLQIDLNDQDIKDSRQEIWSFFPREVEK